MFAVSADGAEITTVEGLTERRRLARARCSRRSASATACSAASARPGFLTTITAGLRENPDADRGARPAR